MNPAVANRRDEIAGIPRCCVMEPAHAVPGAQDPATRTTG